MSATFSQDRKSCEFTIVAPGGNVITFNIDMTFGDTFHAYRINKEGTIERVGTVYDTITGAQNAVAAYMGRMYLPAIVDGSFELMDLPEND